MWGKFSSSVRPGIIHSCMFEGLKLEWVGSRRRRWDVVGVGVMPSEQVGRRRSRWDAVGAGGICRLDRDQRQRSVPGWVDGRLGLDERG